MNHWHSNYDPYEMEALARRLQEAFNYVNHKILDAAGIKSEDIVEQFAEIDSKLLRFDSHSNRCFREALEQKKVKTLAQDNLFLACVLTAAVALSEFKNLPRSTRPRFTQKLTFIRKKSTTSLGLMLFATLSFQTLVGTIALGQIKKYRSQRLSSIRAKISSKK